MSLTFPHLFPHAVVFAVLVLSSVLPYPLHGEQHFRGVTALQLTNKVVSFGERSSGTKSLDRLKIWIQQQLRQYSCEISLDEFTATTPAGKIPMTNIIAKFPGHSGKAIAVTGHYDTKKIPNIKFVGANDGGSSTGFLLELAHALSQTPHQDDIYLVFFDGEEAVAEWSETDSRYGSRHLVSQWAASGVLGRLRALINIDMIGDKQLDILKDLNSSESLRRLVWQVAKDLGHGRYFLDGPGGGIDDDHRPFAEAGVEALDLIDLNFGPDNSYWHTARDTMDKLSAHSFQVVGDVVLETLRRLQAH